MPSAGNKARASDFDEALVANTASFEGMRFETGTATVAVSAGASYFTETVAFDDPFSAAPVVTCAVKQGNGGSICVVGGIVDSVSTTGFDAYVRSGDDGNFGGSANYDIDWIAIGA